MIARLPLGAVPPRAALERLIARHGARAVLTGLVMALLRPGRKRGKRVRLLSTDQMGPHLRRDLGLLPHNPTEPSRYWNHY